MHIYSQCFNCAIVFYMLLINLVTILGDNESKRIGKLPEDVVSELYIMYKEAVVNDSPMISRRLLNNNREFSLHVKKLKEVNGFKHHNLLIKQIDLSNPIIYINNPVESRLPHAYLSPREFKEFLEEKVQRQRTEFEKSKGSKPNKKIFKIPQRTTTTIDVEKETVSEISKQNTSAHKDTNISPKAGEVKRVSKSKLLDEFQSTIKPKSAIGATTVKNILRVVNKQKRKKSIVSSHNTTQVGKLKLAIKGKTSSNVTIKPITNTPKLTVKEETAKLSSITTDNMTSKNNTSSLTNNTMTVMEITTTVRDNNSVVEDKSSVTIVVTTVTHDPSSRAEDTHTVAEDDTSTTKVTTTTAKGSGKPTKLRRSTYGKPFVFMG